MKNRVLPHKVEQRGKPEKPVQPEQPVAPTLSRQVDAIKVRFSISVVQVVPVLGGVLFLRGNVGKPESMRFILAEFMSQTLIEFNRFRALG